VHPVKSVIFVLIVVGRVILRWLLFLPPHPPCNLRSSVPLPTLLVTPASLPIFNEIKIERIRNSDSSLNTLTPANELPLILHHVRTPHGWWARGRAAKRVSRHDHFGHRYRRPRWIRVGQGGGRMVETHTALPHVVLLVRRG